MAFVSFEGGEGVGKSTLARRLAVRLELAGVDVWFTAEPWHPRVRSLLLDGRLRLPSLAELFLFLLDRRLHTEHIARELSLGAVVICDRFRDSTVAYQGFGRRLGGGLVRFLGRFALYGGYDVDRTYLLDAPVEYGLSRQCRVDRIGDPKRLVFHRRVRAGFLWCASLEPHRFLVLDALQPLEVLEGLVWHDFRSRFGLP